MIVTEEPDSFDREVCEVVGHEPEDGYTFYGELFRDGGVSALLFGGLLSRRMYM